MGIIEDNYWNTDFKIKQNILYSTLTTVTIP